MKYIKFNLKKNISKSLNLIHFLILSILVLLQTQIFSLNRYYKNYDNKKNKDNFKYLAYDIKKAVKKWLLK